MIAAAIQRATYAACHVSQFFARDASIQLLFTSFCAKLHVGTSFCGDTDNCTGGAVSERVCDDG